MRKVLIFIYLLVIEIGILSAQNLMTLNEIITNCTNYDLTQSKVSRIDSFYSSFDFIRFQKDNSFHNKKQYKICYDSLNRPIEILCKINNELSNWYKVNYFNNYKIISWGKHEIRNNCNLKYSMQGIIFGIDSSLLYIYIEQKACLPEKYISHFYKLDSHLVPFQGYEFNMLNCESNIKCKKIIFREKKRKLTRAHSENINVKFKDLNNSNLLELESLFNFSNIGKYKKQKKYVFMN